MPFFGGFIQNFFLLLFLSFFSPFLFSLSFTLYPFSIHWKSFGLSPSNDLGMEYGQLGDLAYFTTNFAPEIGQVFSGIALPEFGLYSKWTNVWMC